MFISLFCSIFYSKYIEVVILLSLLVPSSICVLYKSNIYLEDVLSTSNDMNSALIFMAISLTLLIFLSSWATPDIMYNSTLMVLLFILMMCFSTSNLLWFYILFESSLLPILFLIVGWGYQPERLQAGLYMILYTVFGSMPLLIIILYMNHNYCSLNFFLLPMINNLPNFYLTLGFLAFLVKLPVYSLHVWLPKAHVEAPLGGSMILAGVLLKLGGYGMYIYGSLGSWVLTNFGYVFLISVAMWGGLYASLICLSQMDIKSMIAYSSIVHMSLVVLGIMSYTAWGFSCSLITMLAHGWASSALFLLAYVTYEKVGSRSFNYTKGMLSVLPVLGYFWFLLAAVNMSVPPTINLVGELCGIPVAMWMNLGFLLVLLLTLFVSVAYNMYLYTKVNHGPVSMLMLASNSLHARGMMAITGHLLPLFFLLSMHLISPCTENCM
nr:NADH dehydrogenase subunit 4 [Laeocathaica amdoana]